MKVHFEKRVLAGFFITIIVLVILGVFSFNSTQRLIDTARLLSHASRVISSADQITGLSVDIETGQRGFTITGDTTFLEPFTIASKVMTRHLSTLDSLTINNSLQHAKVNELRGLIDKQSVWTQHIIQVRNEGFEKARDLIAAGEGKRTTDAIRALVKNIQTEERALFRKGNTISSQHLQQFQYSFIGLAIAITLIIGYLFYNINDNLKARNQAEIKLKKVADETRDLYDNAPCGYLSVDTNIFLANINQTLLTWLGYTREEVIGKMKYEDLLSPESKAAFIASFEEDFEKYKQQGYVSDLEFEFRRKDGTIFQVIVNSAAVFNDHGEFVKSRSTVSNNTERKKAEIKIKHLNQELEAFTYSVSHDLRAPLRSVTGYTQILKEDFGHILDPEGHKLIHIILSNAKRMGQLVDDLLDFSRMGRKELVRANVNMNELVQDILQELTAQENGRKLNIRVMPLDPSKADLSMLRQVWTNLISNALKYSSKKEVTEIEIGSRWTDARMQDGQEEICYYISDNGAGFDMQYANKLFGVFQRLHKMNEFEGTGVGLALVKRIIQRHGGRVWAEGKINEGAKFYYTLPQN